MKSLIWGLPGQDSWFLSKLLLERGDDVVGCHRHTYLSEQFKDFPSGKLNIVYCDMMDPKGVDEIVESVAPDEIYNLAAHSFVGDSFDKPAQVISNNVISHTNLLESVRRLSPKSKVYYSGSSEELEIKSPYGVSKAAIKHLNDIYRESYGLFICHAQNFNHTSWRHSPQFLLPKVTKYVTNLKRWLDNYKIISTDGSLIQGQCINGSANFSWLPKLELGSLLSIRDVSYAEDVMRAAIIMMGQEKSDTYKVASGQRHNIQYIVNCAFSVLDLNFEDFVIKNDKFLRPNESIPKIEPCPEIRALGWFPTLDLKDLIIITMNEYFNRGIK